MKQKTILFVVGVLMLLQLLTISIFILEKNKYNSAITKNEGRTVENDDSNLGRICGKKICNVNFTILQTERDLFQDQTIRITGYLAIHNGLLMIFPTEVDYLTGQTDSALQIRLDYTSQKSLFESHGYSYIRLMAVYSATDPTAMRANFLGVLTSPYKLLAIPDRPRKERWSDIRIHIDDFEGFDKK